MSKTGFVVIGICLLCGGCSDTDTAVSAEPGELSTAGAQSPSEQSHSALATHTTEGTGQNAIGGTEKVIAEKIQKQQAELQAARELQLQVRDELRALREQIDQSELTLQNKQQVVDELKKALPESSIN